MRPQRRNRSTSSRDRSRELRQQQNWIEAALWKELRNGKLKGFKFRRQHPIGTYVCDFYCANAALVIELDGATHVDREEYNEKRQNWLEAQGLMVIRCPNHEAWDDLDPLLEQIWRNCCQRTGIVLD